MKEVTDKGEVGVDGHGLKGDSLACSTEVSTNITKKGHEFKTPELENDINDVSKKKYAPQTHRKNDVGC